MWFLSGLALAFRVALGSVLSSVRKFLCLHIGIFSGLLIASNLLRGCSGLVSELLGGQLGIILV